MKYDKLRCCIGSAQMVKSVMYITCFLSHLFSLSYIPINASAVAYAGKNKERSDKGRDYFLKGVAF